MRVFISHSSKNAEQAAEICALVEERGHSCFLAPRDIRSGYVYAEEIINGIDGSDIVLLLMSEGANQSPHVLREVERAVSRQIPIVVYKLENVALSKSMEYFLMTHQWLSSDTEKGYREIPDCLDAMEHKKVEPVEKQEVAPAKKSNKWLIPAVVGLVAAFAVIIAVVLVNGGKDKESSVSESDVSSQTTEVVTPVSAQLGDRIILGNYNGEPMEWRVIQLSEDGTRALVITDKIITMKAFDAAEGGKFNTEDGQTYYGVSAAEIDDDMERRLRGDNRWELSNIRTWLNSDRENVVYNDQAPVASAMCEGKNGYNTEAGFLTAFSEEERGAIVTTELTTNGVVTEDRVFLLSREQYALLVDADVAKYTVPTDVAAENDGTRWYELNVNDYSVTDHYWWLRDAVEDTAGDVYFVNISISPQEIAPASAALEGYGIRPAMTIDLTNSAVTVE